MQNPNLTVKLKLFLLKCRGSQVLRVIERGNKPWKIENHCSSVREAIPLLSGSEYVSDVFFPDVWISKQCQTVVRSMLRAVVLKPGRRNCKMYTGGDTTRFLGMWLVDSSHRNAVAIVLLGCGIIVKHWPVRCYKQVGYHCLRVYFSNTYCINKRLFGTLIAFSVMCSLWTLGPIFFDLLQTFCELMIKGDFKLWWFPVRSRSSTNKKSYFLGLEKVTTFVWYPTIVAEKLGYLNKWRLSGAPLLDCKRLRQMLQVF